MCEIIGHIIGWIVLVLVIASLLKMIWDALNL
jgi:hypothetical protein